MKVLTVRCLRNMLEGYDDDLKVYFVIDHDNHGNPNIESVEEIGEVTTYYPDGEKLIVCGEPVLILE